jgi:hypothetical protein
MVAMSGEAQDTGSIRLGFGGQYLSVGFAGVWLAFVPIIWAALVENRYEVHLSGSLVGLALLGCPTLACYVLRMRQPHGASLRWDSWGVEELDGLSVRTSVPWSELQARAARWKVRASKANGIELRGAEGRRIVAWELEPWRVREIRRRITASNLDPLIELCRRRGVLGDEAPSWQGLELDRPGGWRLWLGRLGLVGLAIALAARAPLVITVLVAGVAALRCHRVWVELRGLRDAQRAWATATRLEVTSNEANVISGRIGADTTIHIDLSELHHPDARLAERRGVMWVQGLDELARPQDVPYRENALHAAAVIETAAARSARRSLMQAAATELALRALLVVGTLAVAIACA